MTIIKPDWVEVLGELEDYARERGWSITELGHAGLIRRLMAPQLGSADQGASCWFCGRSCGSDYLIAGYDTWDEQRLACLDCDRAIHALREKGWLESHFDLEGRSPR